MEKQRSDFGTFRTTQISRMQTGVKVLFNIELLEQRLETEGFSTLYFMGRMGLDRYGQISSFIKGIDYADRH